MDLHGEMETKEHTVSTGTNGVLTPDLSKALQAEILTLKMREKMPFAVMETSGKTVNVYHLKYDFVPIYGWALATVCVLAHIPNKKLSIVRAVQALCPSGDLSRVAVLVHTETFAHCKKVKKPVRTWVWKLMELKK
jgi:hypothetical protein